MSYILDALKKAEAERHLGSIPHLHAQPAAALPVDVVPLHTKKTVLLVAGVLLAGCAALVWFQPWQSAWRDTSPAAQPIQPLPAPLSAVASVTPPALPPVADNAAASAPEIIAISPPPAPVNPVPATKHKKVQAVAKPAAPVTPVTAQAPKAPAPSAAASDGDLKLSTALTQNNPLSAVITQRELPEQIQRELPGFTIGGYIYSENQRERQLLINRRLVHEGEEAAPGVILEAMLPKAAVFNYRGYRYRVAY